MAKQVVVVSPEQRKQEINHIADLECKARELEAENARLRLIERVLEITDQYDDHDLFWRAWPKKDYPGAILIVNCSDTFWWGTADGEEITADNIGVFEQCYADLKAADPDDCTATCYAGNLFAARVRKMRPQGAAYPGNRKLWLLFDACGPERDTGHGNPYQPGPYQEKMKERRKTVYQENGELKAEVARLREAGRELDNALAGQGFTLAMKARRKWAEVDPR